MELEAQRREQATFDGLCFDVEPGLVFTPRPTSELLVRRAVAWIGARPAVVADVGTGSGAIAVAIARRSPSAVIWAVDTSDSAVRLARLNAARHGVDDRVRVRRGDLLEPVRGRVDLIVANLPYLPWDERRLHPELDGEPSAAVYAPGDGLEPYRRLVAAASESLASRGLLLLQMRGRVVAMHRGAPLELAA